MAAGIRSADYERQRSFRRKPIMQIAALQAVTNKAHALLQVTKANAATTGTNGTSGSNGTSGTGGTGSSSTSANSVSSLTSEQTFLQLLIAQIQNQDPLNPTDSIQFIGQLVQYSELEQLMGINQGVQTLDGSTTAASSTNSANARTQPTS